MRRRRTRTGTDRSALFTRSGTIAILAALAILLGAGCYYLRYEALVRTHVDLMVAMTEKRRDLRTSGASTENLAEYRYPLERARDFARIVGSHFGERASYERFGRFADRYEALLEIEDPDLLTAGLEELRDEREKVFAALDEE